MKNKEKLGVTLILLSAFGYALMPILSVGAIKEGTAVPSLLFVRFIVTSLILWPLILIKGYDYKVKLKTLIYIITLALLGFTVASVSIYTAYKYISSSIATLILFAHPILVMIIEKVVRRSKVGFKKILAVIVTSIGLIVVLYVKEPINAKGVILSFISSIAYGIYCFGLSEKETQKLNGIVVTAYVATTTAVATGIQCLATGVPLLEFNSSFFLSGISLALFSTILASITFFEGLSIVGPSSATLISSVEPMMVVILSAIFLSEIFTLNTILGGIIIILGIIILEYKK